MNRREFVSWAGVSSLATFLPVAIAACSPSTDSTAADSAATDATTASAPPADDGLVKVGSVDDFNTQDSVSITAPEKVIAVRDPANSDDFLALTANCNHNNCSVNWNANDNVFVCPCHGSRFGTDGAIVRGPATEELRPLPVTVNEAGDILVEV